MIGPIQEIPRRAGSAHIWRSACWTCGRVFHSPARLRVRQMPFQERGRNLFDPGAEHHGLVENFAVDLHAHGIEIQRAKKILHRTPGPCRSMFLMRPCEPMERKFVSSNTEEFAEAWYILHASTGQVWRSNHYFGAGFSQRIPRAVRCDRVNNSGPRPTVTMKSPRDSLNPDLRAWPKPKIHHMIDDKKHWCAWPQMPWPTRWCRPLLPSLTMIISHSNLCFQ